MSGCCGRSRTLATSWSAWRGLPLPPLGRLGRAAGAAGALAVLHCSAPLDAPSAFSNERFLCDEAGAATFEALVDECRQAREGDASACAGVISLEGVIDEVPVVLDAFVSTAIPVDRVEAGTRVRVFAVRAQAPYFNLRFDPPFIVEEGTGRLSPLFDFEFRHIVDLEARGGNYLAVLVDQDWDIQLDTPRELRAQVSGDLSRGGSLTACFHLFHE